MKKRPGMSIGVCVVVLLILSSLSSVMGYQSVQTSQQNLIEERINQRELLFQTIVDIANNKEIQRVILKSQMNKGIFPTSEIPFVTKNQIRQMYLLGLILSKVISKSRMPSMIGNYPEKNSILNINIIFGFILAVIMMTSALLFIPTIWTVILLLKLGILPKLEGFLEITALILFGIAFYCWAIMPDEFWDWIYNLFPSKFNILINRGNTCIPLE